jgi:nitrogen fixation NifU-like protein|tara:strand:+ start:1166 stop:1540 length:375 start_codon:yes stop_codon:yes gene_type:complete
MYSKELMEHFRKPRNQGRMENPDAVGKGGNPVCGDVMYIYLKIEDDRIEDVKFETFGCAAAIGTTSKITEMVKGKTLDEAIEVTKKDVEEAVGGLPPVKRHCSNLSASVLHKAINKYRSEQAKT